MCVVSIYQYNNENKLFERKLRELLIASATNMYTTHIFLP